MDKLFLLLDTLLTSASAPSARVYLHWFGMMYRQRLNTNLLVMLTIKWYICGRGGTNISSTMSTALQYQLLHCLLLKQPIKGASLQEILMPICQHWAMTVGIVEGERLITSVCLQTWFSNRALTANLHSFTKDTTLQVGRVCRHPRANNHKSPWWHRKWP